MMKTVFLIVLLFVSTKTNAQTEADVTIRVFASGGDFAEAQFNAGKSAIEQAFGSFISSTTTLLNDRITKDETIAISNGNINKIEIISTTTNSDTQNTANFKYSIIADVTVSITKLSKLAVSKGISSDFNGNIFAINIKKQILTEKSEFEAIYNTFVIANEYFQDGFDYLITTEEPKSLDGGNQNWTIPINIQIKANNNLKFGFNVLSDVLKNISMSQSEINNYGELNKNVFNLKFQGIDYTLRNENSALLFLTINKMLRYYYKRFFFTYNYKGWYDGRGIESELYRSSSDDPHVINFDTLPQLLKTKITLTIDQIGSITQFDVKPIKRSRIKIENHSFLIRDADSLYNYYISVVPAYMVQHSKCRANNVLTFVKLGEYKDRIDRKPKYSDIDQFSADLNIPISTTRTFRMTEIINFHNNLRWGNYLYAYLTASFWSWDNDCSIYPTLSVLSDLEQGNNIPIIYLFSKEAKTESEIMFTRVFRE